MIAASASFAQGKLSSPVSTAQAIIGQPLPVVERTFKRGGFSWKPQYDNRDIIFVASKGKLSYTMTFSRRSRDKHIVCEEIGIPAANRPFLSLAPRNWAKQEIYIGTNASRDSASYTVFLISRKPNGSYLRWFFFLKPQNRAIRCVPEGNKWKLTIRPDWPTSPVNSYYYLTLRGVNFDRNGSGDDGPTEEAYTPGYYAKVSADGKALRWRKGDKERVVYFPHQH